jgi:hypothetical protein
LTVEAQLIHHQNDQCQQEFYRAFQSRRNTRIIFRSLLVFSIVASTSMASIFIHFLGISLLNENIISQVFRVDFFERGGFSAHFKNLDMTCYVSLVRSRSNSRISARNPSNGRFLKSTRKIKIFAKTLVK